MICKYKQNEEEEEEKNENKKKNKNKIENVKGGELKKQQQTRYRRKIDKGDGKRRSERKVI